MTILTVDNLSIEFKTFDGYYHALDNINFNVEEQEILGIVGETGCGKSVTARAIMGLLPSKVTQVKSGRIVFEKNNLLIIDQKEKRKIRKKEMSMIFQDPMTYLNPVISIGIQLYDVVKVKNNNKNKNFLKKKVIELIETVQLPNPKNILKMYPHELSGGMRQRILIAMALAGKPKLLIADEPTTALDVTIQAQILKLIEDLKKNLKLSVILITHDLGVLAQYVDRVVVMYAGQVVETAKTKTIFKDPKHPYTKGLLKAIPKINENNSMETIPGSLPDLIHPPIGCRFYDRCEKSLNKCKTKLSTIEIDKDHIVNCVNI